MHAFAIESSERLSPDLLGTGVKGLIQNGIEA